MTLEMSIAQRDDLPAIIDLLTLYNDGFDKVINNLSSYDPDYIHGFLAQRCNVYVGIADDLVEGVFIYQWMGNFMDYKKVVNLHVCTMNNQFEWHDFFVDEVVPDVSKYADNQVWILQEDDLSLILLYKKYGYKFKWREDINRFICLQKL